MSLEQTLLTRPVALNHERAEEEKRGFIRWLSPEYQAPAELAAAFGKRTKARIDQINQILETLTALWKL